MPLITPTRHLVVAMTLTLTGGEKVLMQAMVSLAMTTNFMSTTFATKWTVPQHKVAPPILMETIDSHPLQAGPVATSTEPLQMRMGNYMEWLEFYVAAAPHFSILLGLERLQAHYPQIVWLDEVI